VPGPRHRRPSQAQRLMREARSILKMAIELTNLAQTEATAVPGSSSPGSRCSRSRSCPH